MFNGNYATSVSIKITIVRQDKSSVSHRVKVVPSDDDDFAVTSYAVLDALTGIRNNISVTIFEILMRIAAIEISTDDETPHCQEVQKAYSDFCKTADAVIETWKQRTTNIDAE